MIPRKGTSLFIIIVAVAVFSFSVSFSHPIFVYSSEPTIRVCLAEGVGSISLRVEGNYHLSYQGVSISKATNSTLKFEFSRDGSPKAFLPNQELQFLSPIRIVPDTALNPESAANSDRITFKSQTYPGEMEIVPSSNGTYRLIDMVPLETYLRGVVPNELVNHLTTAELQACMAQAIAARNYAFFRMSGVDSSDKFIMRNGFDVYADTRDQVYSGIQRYNSLADSAIEFTSGMIVEYNGEPARCFFHSTCGGHTEDVQHVWQGQPPQPYLQGVSDIDSANGQPFCIYSPQFFWTVTLSAAELNTMLRRNLSAANPMYTGIALRSRISSLKVVDRFTSFRADTLQIKTADGTAYFVRGDRTRYFFKSPGGTLLRSSLFRITLTRDADGVIRSAVIKGQGSGHGVGMCQWGALGMSRLGYTYQQILSHYYPGTEVKKVY
ncbi:MAG TPA: SpoIID/LytB domain-containing protein [Candidatus Kryptonia bacterium]